MDCDALSHHHITVSSKDSAWGTIIHPTVNLNEYIVEIDKNACNNLLQEEKIELILNEKDDAHQIHKDEGLEIILVQLSTLISDAVTSDEMDYLEKNTHRSDRNPFHRVARRWIHITFRRLFRRI